VAPHWQKYYATPLLTDARKQKQREYCIIRGSFFQGIVCKRDDIVKKKLTIMEAIAKKEVITNDKNIFAAAL